MDQPSRGPRTYGGANRARVFFDGACPMCRREIAWYRRRPGADAIDWVDLRDVTGAEVAPGLGMAEALARLHVRLPDGRYVSGAAAFAEIWTRLPGLRPLGHLARLAVVRTALELAYRAFLRLRPALHRLTGAREDSCPAGYPRWLARELRSDHAGETGAVAIYRGILAAAGGDALRDFARRHLETERRHLQAMEALLAPPRRSRLLPLWRCAGFTTGFLPALLGEKAVYVTIDAVESFVERHYAAQIGALGTAPRWRAVRLQLEQCRRDELGHRDEARRLAPAPAGIVARAWAGLVELGSRAGVSLARRV